MVALLITDGGTHSPEKWADAMLEQFVPMPLNATNDQMLKVLQARMKIRPTVVNAMAAVRAHEQAAFEFFTTSERELLVDMVATRHSRSSKFGHDIHDLHHHTKKVKSDDEWIDRHVRGICAAVVDCDGDKPPSNEMTHRVYEALKNWYIGIQYAERSHHVTSRRLLPPCDDPRLLPPDELPSR